MRMQLIGAACLALASASVLAQEPLAPQSSVDWPPKAVAKPATGKVPDYSGDDKNGGCLECHKSILKVATGRKNISNLHLRHLTSKKTGYEGKNRDCLTCHEMIQPTPPSDDPDYVPPAKEGWFVKGGVYHPSYFNVPREAWKKQIWKAAGTDDFARVNALRTQEPHPYKPNLKQLVCKECHGPDSKIKTFYGRPEGK